jgi:DNA-damage-inducible protein J
MTAVAENVVWIHSQIRGGPSTDQRAQSSSIARHVRAASSFPRQRFRTILAFAIILCYIVAQEVKAMSENSVVRARIDERIKVEAAAVLAAMGLSVSDAFRMMMVRIAADKALPFSPLVPNETTIEAMKAARRGELTQVSSSDELLANLNADD